MFFSDLKYHLTTTKSSPPSSDNGGMSEGLGYAGGDNSPLRGRSKLSFKSLFDCALGNIMKSSEGSQAVIVIIIKLIIIFKKLLKEGGHVGGRLSSSCFYFWSFSQCHWDVSRYGNHLHHRLIDNDNDNDNDIDNDNDNLRCISRTGCPPCTSLLEGMWISLETLTELISFLSSG